MALGGEEKEQKSGPLQSKASGFYGVGGNH
jgi:hypothetical protein